MAVTVSPERDVVATPVQRALREAFYAGAISLGLFVLFIGLKTGQNISNELVVTTRWGLLAAVVIATAVGRFLYVGPHNQNSSAPRRERPKPQQSRRNPDWNAETSTCRHHCTVPASARDRSLVGFRGSLKWVDNFGIHPDYVMRPGA